MEIRSLGFRTDLALLQLGGSTVEDRGDRLVVRTPANPGYHWGNFLLLAKAPGPGGMAAVLTDFEETFPEAEHRAIGVAAGAVAEGDLAGLAIETNTVLTADRLVPSTNRNEEATYRPLADDADWAQLIDLEVACFGGDQPDDFATFTERRVRTFRRWADAGHGAWWGAFLDGELAATMGLFRAGDGLARFQNVATRPRFRRRGLAGTLAYEIGRWGLRDLAATTLVIVADPAADAIRLYRSLGFVDAEPMVQLYRPPAG